MHFEQQILQWKALTCINMPRSVSFVIALNLYLIDKQVGFIKYVHYMKPIPNFTGMIGMMVVTF